MKKEATRSILASILSIIIGLVVGCVIILIVGMTSDTLSPSSAWDGIRLIFGGLFSTGRDAAGALTFGFNPTNIGNMLFRATPLILQDSPWRWLSRRACSISAPRDSI